MRTLNQATAIVVLSLNEEDQFVIAAMKAGANSFVNKSEPLKVLLANIDLALKAPATFSATTIAAALKRKSENFGLSQRELQILTQLHRGENIKELAQTLFIAESTLKKHLSAIYQKLAVKNRLQAVGKARQAGLLQ